MSTTLLIIFILVYASIALEHYLHINKSSSALIGSGLLWIVYALATDSGQINKELSDSLISTAQIVFFLIGAMTIVEVVDAHQGFDVITSKIKTNQLINLMWMVGIVTFFLSSILDNLTTAIVMVSLMKKILDQNEDRLLFTGIIIIAANAGGAWTPIGDVTTTMLWIGGQITSLAIMKSVFIPAIISLLIPLLFIAWSLKGKEVILSQKNIAEKFAITSLFERNVMFYMGLGVLVTVPIFKTLTGLPPFMGILFGLGLLWLVGDLIHSRKNEDDRETLTLVHALSRIDMASIVFFIGILLAVATLEHAHILSAIAHWLDSVVGDQAIIVILIGLVSAVVDNVPLVAASMGMYSLEEYPTDSFLWQFLAYSAGTGGSILIIGSAAGVAAMGLEKIDFFWYVKNISGLALIGYLAGAGAYILQYNLTH
jgi:Na+/H+ antiporter NhaD/arsenite permease-like protein